MNQRIPSSVLTLCASLLIFVSHVTSCGLRPRADTAVAQREPSAQQPIVNGSYETGWPAVGALALDLYGLSSFCSATLIAPEWVLTAAHCLMAHDNVDFEPTPRITKFFIGSEVRYRGGETHQADAFYVHPSYSAASAGNDIGLVHLSEPVYGVAPIAVADRAYLSPGTDVFYVGFGASDGRTEQGSGIKRSTWISVSEVYQRMYSNSWNGSGVCFGDSGGPGLYQRSDGGWVTVGVNSTILATAANDACRSDSFHTRVAYYHNWITGYLNGEPPTCTTDLGLCHCPQACRADGSCNNTVCQTLSCRDVYLCMIQCNPSDQGCLTDCQLQATAEAEERLGAMFQCMADHCQYAQDDAQAYQQCSESNCQTEIDACLPRVTGAESCRQVYECLADCGVEDATCQQACFEAGSQQAQDQLLSMVECFDDQCGSLPEDAWQQCVTRSCSGEIEACMPPVDCHITGGDCPAGQACSPTPSGTNDCYPSHGKGDGQACDPSLTTALDCADGLICVPGVVAGASSSCMPFCQSPEDCAPGLRCDMPVFADVPDVGICSCLDADYDGVCADRDCDDSDGTAHPGASEACGDSVDNNCNGQVDEGCDGCVDADHDGYCSTMDCNDSFRSVHPGAPEACGDGVDNNCNGQVDEGCDNCVDADDDGYCAQQDCDDANPDVPDFREVCGDLIDNDCDGQIDEGCAVKPTASEGPSQSGGCSCSTGGSSPAAPLSALLLVLLALRIVRRRPRHAYEGANEQTQAVH